MAKSKLPDLYVRHSQNFAIKLQKTTLIKDKYDVDAKASVGVCWLQNFFNENDFFMETDNQLKLQMIFERDSENPVEFIF